MREVRRRGSIFNATFGTALAVTLTGFASAAHADPIPQGWEASNLAPIGYSALENRRGAFKMTLKKAENGRWYMYLGHLWHRGWTIVDVTDPKNPTFVKHIPGPPNTWTIQVTSHGNILVTALQKAAIGWGLDEKGPYDEGVLIWDISDPVNPKVISHWKTDSDGTHRNSYPGGRYAYLSASAKGLRRPHLRDPRPRRSRRSRRRPAAGGCRARREASRGPTRRRARSTVPPMISPDGKLATLAYAPSLVNLDISDPASPKLVGSLQFTPPFFGSGGQALHTAFPLWDRNLVHVNSEPQKERCNEPLHFAGLVDNRNPAQPRLDLAVSGAGAAEGRDLQEFLREGRPVRAAQRQSGNPSAGGREAGQSDLSHLLQRRPARVQHPRPLAAGRDRLVHPAEPGEQCRRAPARRASSTRPRTCWSTPAGTSS